MSRQASAPDWDPEETTSNDAGSRAVRELQDPDALVMLGKLARSVANSHSKIDELAREWRQERRERRRSRRFQTAGLAAVFTALQGLSTLLHQMGILK